MIKKPFTNKIVVTSLIALILLVPLKLIEEKINDREHYQIQAKNSIAKSWTGSQTIMGPVIVLPYELTWSEKVRHHKSDEIKTEYRKKTQYRYIIPTQLSANIEIDASKRYKGIFQIPVYETNLEWAVTFSKKQMNEVIDEIKKNSRFSKFKTPFMALTVSDPRGISQVPMLTDSQKTLPFEPGTNGQFNHSGAHIMLNEMNLEQVQPIQFSISLAFRGMERLSIIPAAKNSSIEINANWPHPSFGGEQLPQQRSIDNTGFSAQWQLTTFSNPWEELLASCSPKGCHELFAKSLSVELLQPVDVYLQSERSIKYGILFILLTFVAFFIFEVIQRQPIHPIQYTLIGLSLAIFYLLLIALSEHIRFGAAYTIAATACVSLLSTYVRFVLSKLKYSISFFLSLSLLYAVLFVVIQAEDYALLMGSLLVFVALGTLMWVTRKIDWYEVENQVLKMAQSEQDTQKASHSIE